MERNDCYGDTDKLLFDILQELKKLNESKEIKIENIVVPNGVPCKYCNGTHENRGQILVCAKKIKKDGVK